MERDINQEILIDIILSDMKFGQSYVFPNLYSAAILKIALNASVRNKIEDPQVFSSADFDHPIKFLKELMIKVDLIEYDMESVSEFGNSLRLSVFGESVRKSGGWKKYLDKQEDNNKSKHH